MLDMFFNPDAIAVIGASANPGKLGHGVLSNLIESGYGGEVYPINPRAGTILGLQCYPSVLDVPGPIDLVVVVVPSRVVASVLEESGEKGVKGAIIISAGFKEAGGEGASMEQDLLDIANRYGMRIIGPNCLGIIVPSVPMNASFASGMPQVGTIAFTSQSGALCTAILDYALAENIGFSHFVSLGNKADVDEAALLAAWAEEEQTNVVIAYVEGLNDGREFMLAARKAAREKPVIAVKSGRTASGSRAVSSHTGSLAGSDAAYDAAFAQCGVIRAASVQELFDYSTAFAYQPLLQGNRIAIITNAGGPGVMATDAMEQNGLVLAQLGAETQAALEAALPPAASTNNPVDVLGDARAERYGAALKSVLEDPGVDGVMVILTPQLMTEVEGTARTLIEVGRNAAKPVLSCWMGKQVVSVALDLLARNQIPNYPFPERAVSALGAMYRYWSWRRQPTVEVEPFDVDSEAVASLFESVKKDGRKDIGDAEARHILEAYGITAARSMVATTPEELIAHCTEIGYPVVLKIASPDILHKSDVGGIIMGVSDDGEARQSFDTLIARAKTHAPSALVWGVQVQEMVANAREVIIGMNRDPQFGPLVMFGLGGIYVEVLKDVAFRVAPMTRFQAEQMVRSIRSYALLTGVRGEPPADLEAIVDAILRVSQLVTDFPEIAELDVNPLLVRESGRGAVAVDMRLILV
ncbi:MAG TPA: acetate--CoA ligase family protein [Anaerolineae bacterium]|nr:acetate--CoA ligase family protein [Anaerolineae bacterium]